MQARQHRKLLPMSLSSSAATGGGARPLGVGTAGLLDWNSEELLGCWGGSLRLYIARQVEVDLLGVVPCCHLKVIPILLAPGNE